MLNKILHGALNWFLPQACCVCNGLANVAMLFKPSEILDLCQRCLTKISFSKNRCFQCAKHLKESGTENLRCGLCQDFDMVIYQTISACNYKYPLNKLLSGLKFNDRKCIAKILAELLMQKLYSSNFDMPEIIVPMPRHKSELHLVGYNQALEIARYISAYLGLPIVELAEKTMAYEETFKPNYKLFNKKPIFLINKEANKYKHIALIDDLVISGINVRAMAKALVNSSIERIDLWCISRI